MLVCTFHCPFLHDYNVKMPNFVFYGVRKQATTKFCFSFCTWIWSLGIQLQEGSPTFDKVSGRKKYDKDWKNVNSLFKRHSCCCRVIVSLSPYCKVQLQLLRSTNFKDNVCWWGVHFRKPFTNTLFTNEIYCSFCLYLWETVCSFEWVLVESHDRMLNLYSL